MTDAESNLPPDEGPVTVSTMPPVTVPVATKRTWLVETALVMGVSLGESAIYSILSIIEKTCLLYTSPSPRDGLLSRMPSSA